MPTALLALLTLALAAPLDLSRPAVGDAAPPLELETVDGKPFQKPQVTGTVTIVDFWATWCHPCHDAMRDLGTVRGALGPKVRLVFISVGESPKVVRQFLRENPLPEGAEVALDRGGGTARRWGEDGFPTTFIVDEGGIIRHINRGWGAGYQARVMKWVRALMGTTGANGPGPGKGPAREVVRGVEVLRGG